MESVQAYLRKKRVPVYLRSAIKGYYDHMWRSSASLVQSDLFNDIPASLHVRLQVALHREALLEVPLFQTIRNAEVLIEVLKVVRVHISLPGEYIVRQGERSQTMYVVTKGTCFVFVESEHLPGGGGGGPYARTDFAKQQGSSGKGLRRASSVASGPDPTFVLQLEAGDFFNEKALLFSCVLSATGSAASTCCTPLRAVR